MALDPRLTTPRWQRRAECWRTVWAGAEVWVDSDVAQDNRFNIKAYGDRLDEALGRVDVPIERIEIHPFALVVIFHESYHRMSLVLPLEGDTNGPS